MFFINNNQSKIRKRRKQSRTGTYHDRDLSLFCLFKLVVFFSCRKSGMQKRYTTSKAFGKPFHGLIRQCNFRNQYNHLFSLFQNLLNQFHINFCFSAACHSMKQNRSWNGCFPLFTHSQKYPFLFRIQDLFLPSLLFCKNRASVYAFPLHRNHLLIFQPFYDRSRNLPCMNCFRIGQHRLHQKCLHQSGFCFVMFPFTHLQKFFCF